MDKEIVSIMQQACIFAVIAQMIFYFRPNETYEKYLKLLIGMILIAVLFIPLLHLFHMADVQNFQGLVNNYEKNIQNIYENMYKGEVDFGELRKKIEGNEEQLYAIEEEVKARINNFDFGEYQAKDVKITGVTFLDGETNIEDMKIEINMRMKNNRVSKVKIETIEVADKPTHEERKKNEIKELIKEKLGIEKERVSIILNE